MRLSLIYETNGRFKIRILRAIRGQGKTDRQGLFGIMDEFGVDLDTAAKYSSLIPGGHYGEDDIDDKILHRIRAPQAIFKLLKHYDVSPNVAKRLMKFHIDNAKIISKHKPSPADHIVIDQMHGRERLVGLVSLPRGPLKEMGLVVQSMPFKDDIWYVAWPGNEDIIKEILRSTGAKLDLVQGLAFGYPMSDVFNYIRSEDKQTVDKIVGNVDDI